MAAQLAAFLSELSTAVCALDGAGPGAGLAARRRAAEAAAAAARVKAGGGDGGLCKPDLFSSRPDWETARQVRGRWGSPDRSSPRDFTHFIPV